jgi:hypothetical protein
MALRDPAGLATITALPDVRQRVAAPTQRRDQTIQDFHATGETIFPPLRESPKSGPELLFHQTGVQRLSRDLLSVGFRTAG